MPPDDDQTAAARRLFRGAAGQPAAEAAATLVIRTGLDQDLAGAIQHDLPADTASIDWMAAAQLAERLTGPRRSVALLAHDLGALGEPLNADAVLEDLADDDETRSIVESVLGHLDA